VKYQPTVISELYHNTIALAQVHATLAAAAATAPGHSRADELAWSDVAGTRLSDRG
jgi:hypothetical protein